MQNVYLLLTSHLYISSQRLIKNGWGEVDKRETQKLKRKASMPPLWGVKDKEGINGQDEVMVKN
jgi:hypothetical protein